MRELLAAGVAVFAAAVLSAPAFGADVQPWDGANPFACELQYAGTGTDFPRPDADPFCVEYDKTHQNVAQLGVVDFLSKEPARVAAASPKCFYFQRDHWTGYVVQDDPTTQTYHWDGDYFFDKAKGAGGVHVENFSFNGRTADPTQLPGFPDAWKPYFGPGRGGVEAFTVPADPNCVERAQTGQSPYANPDAIPSRCRDAGGPASMGLGLVRLGLTRSRLEDAVGQPVREGRGFLHFCLLDGGKLAVHLSRRGRADFALTTSQAFYAGGLRTGDFAGSARRALRHERVFSRRGSSEVLSVGHHGWRLLVGLRDRRVAYLAAASTRLDRARTARLLAASR